MYIPTASKFDPDENGHFGIFGGRYVPETLMPALLKLKDEYEKIVGKVMQMLIDYYREHGVKNPEQEAIMFGCLMDGIAFNYIVNPKLFPMESIIETVKEKFCYELWA